MGESIVVTNYRKELVNYFTRLGSRYSVWKVFSDFVEVSAIAIHNAVDKRDYDRLEQRYLDVINEYEKEHQNYFAEMFALLVAELQRQVNNGKVVDVLGEIFHELELHNKYNGQFFTPNHLSEFMGKVTIGDYSDIINERGYVTVSEPCSGGGAMIFGFAKAMSDSGYNYTKQMVVTAVDIDIKCVYMTYIQCSLYGIPAVVIHGNTLTVEEWSKWYTPVYVVDGWGYKQYCGMTIQSKNDNTSDDIDFGLKAKVGEQISLFDY